MCRLTLTYAFLAVDVQFVVRVTPTTYRSTTPEPYHRSWPEISQSLWQRGTRNVDQEINWTSEISRNPMQETFWLAVCATGLVIGTHLRRNWWMPTKSAWSVRRYLILCVIFINQLIIKCCATNCTNTNSLKRHLPRTCTPLSVPHIAPQLRREAGDVWCPPPSETSQGCHLNPLCYLLSCWSVLPFPACWSFY